MLDDVKSPLNYSPVYSDTPSSSPDTRFDSPIRGSGGESPLRDPRRRVHIRPQVQQAPSSYSRSSDDSPPICGYRGPPVKMAAIAQGQSSAARVREFKTSHWLHVQSKAPIDNGTEDDRYI